jgi:hypothetical protein
LSTILDEPITHSTNSAERLRTTTAAMRLSFTWFGTRKTLSPAQRSQAAESFGAEGAFLSAGKKLLDTRDPAFRAVTSVRHRAIAYFKGMSLPFPEPGVRLVRQEDVEVIDDRMAGFREELADAVAKLDDRFETLRASARRRLGDLYNDADYPLSLVGLFDVAWDFPSVEPPAYLRRLHPDVYRRECELVRARFDEALELAESAFTEELAGLVEHLAERLSGEVDGRRKVFRDSAVTNLAEFFERFRRLDVGSNEQLDALVDRARNIVEGIDPRRLRDNGTLRQRVATQLASVQSSLDGLLVDRPRRNIIRRPR